MSMGASLRLPPESTQGDAMLRTATFADEGVIPHAL